MHKNLSVKKLLTIFFLLAFLSGCGDGNGKQNSEDNSSSSSPESSKTASDTLLEKKTTDADTSTDTKTQADETQSSDSTVTMYEAVEYIKSLSPSELGLNGKSMREYPIYPDEGIVLVDGKTCIKLLVYERSPNTQTNQILGIFLLARDKSHLYQAQPNADGVTELFTTGLVTPTKEPAKDSTTDQPEK